MLVTNYGERLCIQAPRETLTEAERVLRGYLPDEMVINADRGETPNVDFGLPSEYLPTEADDKGQPEGRPDLLPDLPPGSGSTWGENPHPPFGLPGEY